VGIAKPRFAGQTKHIEISRSEASQMRFRIFVLPLLPFQRNSKNVTTKTLGKHPCVTHFPPFTAISEKIKKCHYEKPFPEADFIVTFFIFLSDGRKHLILRHSH